MSIAAPFPPSLFFFNVETRQALPLPHMETSFRSSITCAFLAVEDPGTFHGCPLSGIRCAPCLAKIPPFGRIAGRDCPRQTSGLSEGLPPVTPWSWRAASLACSSPLGVGSISARAML